MPGDTASPMARVQQRMHAAVTTGSAEITGIPCATVLTAYNALSWVNGLSCHPRLRDANITAGLIPASRDQDHTPWLVRPGPFVGLRHARARSQSVHRIPPPTSVTTAKRPSNGGGTGR